MRLLKTDHAVLVEILNQVNEQLSRADSAAAKGTMDFLWGSLANHFHAEDNYLFPAILEVPRERFGKASVPSFYEVRILLEELKTDHRFLLTHLGQSLKKLRSHVSEGEDAVVEVRERMDTFGARLCEHDGKEEQQIYTWPQALLDTAPLDRLRADLRIEHQVIVGRFVDNVALAY